MEDKEINIKNEPILIHYWESIRERLHEESGLKHPCNTLNKMFEVFFDHMLQQEHDDLEECVDQGFLLTSSGLYLDIRGNEMGIPRRPGKSARGYVEFSVINLIPQTSNPTIISHPSEDNEVDGELFDYTYKEVQELLEEINSEIKETSDGDEIYELRSAVSDITIPQGTKVYSETGFEYHTLTTAVIPKGESITKVEVIGDETGLRYNTDVNTIVASNLASINEEVIVTNITPITGGEDGEEDSDYRRRLLNSVTVNTSVNYLKRQGIIIYSQMYVDSDIRVKATSFNPYMRNKYVAIPPNDNPDVTEFLEKELIANDTLAVYKRGW